jgi:hypothetical protein
MHLTEHLTHTLRVMRKSPSVTAAAVVTLALGIGANTAIFSVVDSILLNPAALRAFRDSGSLVMLWEKMPGMTMPPFVDRMPVAAANVEEWREQARTLESLAAFQFLDCTSARARPCRAIAPSGFRRSRSNAVSLRQPESGQRWDGRSRRMKLGTTTA